MTRSWLLGVSWLLGLHVRSTFSLASSPNTGRVRRRRNRASFEKWVLDSPHEVTEWRQLEVEKGSNIPAYLYGSLIRNGGGLWSAGDNDRYSHIFDGLAKVTAWRFMDGEVYYRNQFIRSHMYNVTRSEGVLSPSITVGPILSAHTNRPQSGFFRTVQAVLNSIRMDNAPVNIWDFNPASKSRSRILSAQTDVSSRASLTMNDLQTTSTQGAIGQPIDGLFGIVAAETAHPMYSLTSAESYNVAVALTLNGFEVALYKENNRGRTLIASVVPHQSNFCYLHSFGLTEQFAVVVLQPLRLDMIKNFGNLLQKGFLRCMEKVPKTEVIVFDLKNSEVVFHESISDQVFFYHTISTVDMNNSSGEQIVSLRLCAYPTSDMVNGENGFLRRERVLSGGSESRNRIPRNAQFCDVLINLDRQDVQVNWIKLKEDQPFELPTTRYSRVFGPQSQMPSGRHPRYVYAYGAYANGSEEYDDWALFKFDMEKRCIAGCFEKDEVYPSEPIFVANPEGSEEDDGVILSQIYDGGRDETALVVLDARRMEVSAEVWSGNTSPMDFHGGWFPHH